jgi:hypothetical protein
MLFVSAASGGPMDIVVLFDMNRTSIAHIEKTHDYITGGFLKEFLRKGDTFHLISFGDTPRIELSRRIEGDGDYRTIIGRLLLLNPLAQTSSPENALRYAETFVRDLPAGREKKVVLFTASALNPTELGARFDNNTQAYIAAIPASFGRLVSGRTMRVDSPVKPEPATAQPPAPILEEPPPATVPPLLTLPETALTDPLPMESDDDEPVPFDKLSMAKTILTISALFLLGIVAVACLVTWKKKSTAIYTAEDFIREMQLAADLPRNSPAGIGLLRKAAALRARTA